MGGIFCTCHHEIDDFDEQVMLSIKEYTRECQRCVSYGAYCKKCAGELEASGCVLHNEDEERAWLSGKKVRSI